MPLITLISVKPCLRVDQLGARFGTNSTYVTRLYVKRIVNLQLKTANNIICERIAAHILPLPIDCICSGDGVSPPLLFMGIYNALMTWCIERTARLYQMRVTVPDESIQRGPIIAMQIFDP